jgi:predicted urease superfamily metal-dependent hydrolase
MTTIPAAFELRGFGKRKMAAIVERAKRLGMTPQRYIKHLVEEDLAVCQRAKTSTFESLLGPGSDEDEAEIDRHVEAARVRYSKLRSRRG